MRVVVPYAGRGIHPLTERALSEHAPGAERIDVSGAEDAYFQLLRRLWADGEACLVVEHDIVLTAEALREATECPEPWCVSPYVHPVGHDPSEARPLLCVASLGCTRFSSELLRSEPDLWERTLGEDPRIGGLSLRLELRAYAASTSWRNLDARLAVFLLLAGRWPHQHSRVIHHHRWSDSELAALRRGVQRSLDPWFGFGMPRLREAERRRLAAALEAALASRVQECPQRYVASATEAVGELA